MPERRNALFELAFNSASEGLVVVDEKSDIILVNQRLLDLFGFEEEELVGKPIEVLIPMSKRKNHVGYRDRYVKDPKSRPMGLAGMSLQGQKKNGEEFPVEVSLNAFEVEGKRRVMGLVTDISARVRMEEELQNAQANLQSLNKELESLVIKRTKALEESQKLYQLISNNFPDGVISVIDDQFNYLFADGRELVKQGFNSQDLVGMPFLNRFKNEAREVLALNLARLRQNEDILCEVEVDGDHYELHMVQISQEKSANKKRFLIVEINITKQKLVELEQAKALQKEKELGEMKSRFVSMASHEFRTPLSAILSSASLIEKYEKESQQPNRLKHTDRIRSSVSNLTDILNDFLSFEKLNENKVSVDLEFVNVCELIEYAVEELEAIRKTGQRIIVDKPSESCEFLSDGKILKNILLNMLSNGLKYSGDNGEVKIGLRMENMLLKLEIADNGIGIPEKDQKNLFERFFRAENVSNIQGTGLGLNIVKKYIELLGGEINFKSKLGEGTTFYIELPVKTRTDE